MIEKTTTNRNYPKPDAKNFLQDDVTRLESALDAIDTDIHTIKQEQTEQDNLIDTKADQTGVDEINNSLAQLREQVEAPPPIPVLSVANRTLDSVTLSWLKVLEAAYYSLDVATDETFSSYVESYNGKELAENTQEIAGLQPNTIYYCRVRSMTRFAASENSTVLPVTPLQMTRTFDYSGSIETWTVPEGVDSITIEAWGAQGGNADNFSGGKGAYLRGFFYVSPGDVFKVLVGQKGFDVANTTSQSGGTGGGGSFVALFQNSTNIPNVVAGGGGGAATLHDTGNTYHGQDGRLTRNGGTESENPGGVDGYGGTTEPHTGFHGATGGGGFYGDGINNSAGSGNYGTQSGPGQAFVNGGNGGTAGSHCRAGGFGGGGAAGFTGGGGGGYSGGGAGSWNAGSKDCGGGGGSYNDGENQTNTAGVRTGNGKVVISW